MAILLDVNVLVALFDRHHIHHDIAHDWFEENRTRGWATCPTTENGFVRVLSNPRYPGGGTAVHDLVALMRRFQASGQHQFWTDAVSLTDDALFQAGAVGGYRQVTDLYLIGLTARHQGVLATFDRAIPWKAVKGGSAELLDVIGAW